MHVHFYYGNKKKYTVCKFPLSFGIILRKHETYIPLFSLFISAIKRSPLCNSEILFDFKQQLLFGCVVSMEKIYFEFVYQLHF